MPRKLRVGLFTPYLDTLGGGEKYLLNIAQCISLDYDTYIFWDDTAIKKKAEERFNIDLSNVSFHKNIFKNKRNIKNTIATRGFDVIFYVSDGSIPFLFAKKNFIIFQFPVNWIRVNSLLKLKLRKVDKLICYSEFVKKYLVKTFKHETIVIPPFIDLKYDKKTKKENMILSVGRFTQGMNRKKQEVLIDVFKSLCDEGLNKWKLVIAGSYLPEEGVFFNELSKTTSGYPIEIVGNISYSALVDYYGRAKIYWHAAGYGEDLDEHPEVAEHFGITTVEAMAAGAVPIVINAGGQKEIVADGQNGYLWDGLEELREKTLKLAEAPKLIGEMSSRAMLRAKSFSEKKFREDISKLVK